MMISEERKERNKQRIIEVSTRLFTLQGIPMTTIAQIAKEARVVNRTVLNIFGTKNNLVLKDMEHLSHASMQSLKEATSTKQYHALSGLEQILFVLQERAKILQTKPELLLLLSEVKVWVSRTNHDRKIVETYMTNLNFLFDIAEKSLDKGFLDGSINEKVDKKQALSILVPSFRAVLQQLAQVQLNPEFNKVIDVNQELQIQFHIIRAGLAGISARNKN